MEYCLIQKLEFYYDAALAQASYCNCPLPFTPVQCAQAASQAMLGHRQDLHKVGSGPAHTGPPKWSGGLSAWAVNRAREGEQSVEIRTADTGPFSLGVENRPWLKETQATSYKQDMQCQPAQTWAVLFLNRHKSLYVTWLDQSLTFSNVNTALIILQMPVFTTFSLFLHSLCNSW